MEGQIIVRAPTATAYEGQLEGALSALSSPGFDIVMDAVGGQYFMPGKS